MWSRRIAAAIATGAFALGGAVPVAEAAFPGNDGEISFLSCPLWSDCEGGPIYVAGPDGANARALTLGGHEIRGLQLDWHPDSTSIALSSVWGPIHAFTGGGAVRELVGGDVDNYASNARWSPDGRSIAFDGGLSPRGIWLMDADGRNRRLLFEGNYGSPSWSPDGRQLAFVGPSAYGSLEDRATDVYVAEPDGSFFRNVTDDVASEYSPSWSPDGKRIGYVRYAYGEWQGDIWSMQPTGFDRRQLTSTPASENHLDWSPTGTRIAFTRENDIWVAGSDGGEPRNITNNPGSYDHFPDWQSLQTKVPQGGDSVVPGLLSAAKPTADAGSYLRGATIRARAELRNETKAPIVMQRGVITARPPGSSRRGGPLYYDFTGGTPTETIAPGAVRVLNGSFVLPAGAPAGPYEIYVTYRDNAGVWHDGPGMFVDVTAPGEVAPPPPPRVTEPPVAPAPVVDRPAAPVSPRADAPSTGERPPAAVTGQAPNTPATTVPNTTPTPATPGAETLGVRVGSFRARRAALLRTGLRVPVTCSARCEVRGRLTRGRQVIATGRGSLPRAGRMALRLKASSRAARRLRGQRRVTLVLRLSVTDAGGAAQTVTRRIRLR